MEQNSYKNQLQQRKINPSKNSWDTLDKRLTEFEKTKKNNKWFFLKYAASIIIALSIGFYFTNSDTKKVTKEIVVEPILKIPKNKLESIIVEPESELVEADKIKPAIILKKNSIISKNPVITSDDKIVINEEVTQKGDFIKKTISADKVQAQILGIEEFQKLKIEEVIAKVTCIKNEKGEVSDVEIEQLLNQAQTSLVANRTLLTSEKFNANYLLAEIEYELDKDFKVRLFEAIVNTLKNPKNVLVSRDN